MRLHDTAAVLNSQRASPLGGFPHVPTLPKNSVLGFLSIFLSSPRNLYLSSFSGRLADCERLKAAILAQDRLRLQASFRSGKEAAVSMAAAIEMAQSGGSAVPVSKLGTEATHAFWEVLSYADLLHDSRIEESFLEALVEVWGFVLSRCCILYLFSEGVHSSSFSAPEDY